MSDYLKKLAYFAYMRCEDTLWVSNIRFNGIFSIDLKTGENTFHGRFQQYPYDKAALHSYAGKYKNKLFFLPQCGESIDFFDLDSEKTESHVISLWNGAQTQIAAGMLHLDNQVYMVPRAVDMPIVDYLLDDKCMRAFAYDGMRRISKYVNPEWDVLTVNSAYANGKLWFALFETNKIASVDIQTEKEELYEIRTEKGLQTVKHDGCDFWVGEGTSVIQWNPEHGVRERYERIFEDPERDYNLVSDFVFYGDYVFVFPQWLGQIVRINKKTKETYQYTIDAEGFRVLLSWRDLRNAFVYGDKLIVNPVGRNCELRIDLQTEEIETREYIVEKNAIYHHGVYYEESDMQLEAFLKYHVPGNG